MALKSLSGLNKLLLGKSAPGVQNPLDPSFAKAASEARDRFRSSLSTKSNAEILEELYARPPMAISPELLDDIARELRSIHDCADSEIILVGSAQFGFSMSEVAARPARPAAQTRRERPAREAKARYRLFSPESDLDIAIIDKGLWERAWKATYEVSMSAQAWRHERPFAEYFFKGWVRPDLLPDEIELKRRWFVENRRLSGKYLNGQHRVNVGLYYDRDFLTSYSGVAIDECRAIEV